MRLAPSFFASSIAAMRARYSAMLLVALPMYRPRVTRGVPSWARITTPIPAGPGLPRLPPSNSSVRVSCIAALRAGGRFLILVRIPRRRRLLFHVHRVHHIFGGRLPSDRSADARPALGRLFLFGARFLGLLGLVDRDLGRQIFGDVEQSTAARTGDQLVAAVQAGVDGHPPRQLARAADAFLLGPGPPFPSGEGVAVSALRAAV